MNDDFKIIENHKEQINKIAGGYQCFSGKRFGMLRAQMLEIPFVKGLSVLDVGCNAGLHSLVASRYCPSVTGVEELPSIHADSLKMKLYFQKKIPEYNPEKVNFIQGPVSEIEGTFESVLAFNVLYHLDKPSLHRLTEILNDCTRVLVQARKKVSKDQNNLHIPGNIVKYLEDLHFQCTIKDPGSSRPFIFGSK